MAERAQKAQFLGKTGGPPPVGTALPNRRFCKLGAATRSGRFAAVRGGLGHAAGRLLAFATGRVAAITAGAFAAFAVRAGTGGAAAAVRGGTGDAGSARNGAKNSQRAQGEGDKERFTIHWKFSVLNTCTSAWSGHTSRTRVRLKWENQQRYVQNSTCRESDSGASCASGNCPNEGRGRAVRSASSGIASAAWKGLTSNAWRGAGTESGVGVE